jgi:hypothetical protein
VVELVLEAAMSCLAKFCTKAATIEEERVVKSSGGASPSLGCTPTRDRLSFLSVDLAARGEPRTGAAPPTSLYTAG